jgi:hypothetical protein
MEALKEFVKHAQEVWEGTAKKLKRVSKDVSGLAQSMQELVKQSQQTMMLAQLGMLQNVGFMPILQSPFS